MYSTINRGKIEQYLQQKQHDFFFRHREDSED